MKFKRKEITIIFFCFLVSLITLVLNSKCSFLYPYNGWDDFNSFYTIGKGWANGIIPYRDLFEQKGPFLYLIFMIGYLITPENFIGMFFIEVIFLTFNLYVCSKIIDLFIDRDRRVKYLILVLYAVILTTSIAFVDGGSAEEFNLLFVTITIFYILKYLKSGNLVDISYKDIAINGICCGLAMMIKYNNIGLWFIFMAYICLNLIRSKRYNEAILKGLLFILMMLIPMIIFSIYFYMNDGLFDFINTYFYINLFKYSNDGGILVNIFNTFSNIFIGVFSCYPIVIMIYVMFMYILYRKFKYNLEIKLNKSKLIFIEMIMFSLFVLYYGQSIRQYTFLGIFVIVLLVIIYMYKLFYKFRLFKIISVIYIFVTLIISIDYEYMNTKKEDVVQYRFANIINKYENASLIQYRSIDEVFYTTSGILPGNKYFEQVNIGCSVLSDSCIEQDDIIKNKEVMFVIFRIFDLDENKNVIDFDRHNKISFNKRFNFSFIESNYELIDMYSPNTGYYDNCTYYLYKVKE